MMVKIGYNQMVFVDLDQAQVQALFAIVKDDTNSLEFREVAQGIAVTGQKADMFDLICKLSYTYDLEIM